MDYQENVQYPKSELDNIAQWWQTHQEYDVNEYEDYVEIVKQSEEKIRQSKERSLKADLLQRVATISFVKMAERGEVDDVTATECTYAFASWQQNIKYETGNLREYGGSLYRCIIAHTSQVDWSPDVATSLWKKVGDPCEEYPEWSQPIGAHDVYEKGDKVSHNSKKWVSIVDNNVWEPSVYGWEEINQ